MIESQPFLQRQVLVFAPDLVLRGLKWSIDQNKAKMGKFVLQKGNLSNPEKQECDLLLVFVDLSQPTPIENLKKYKNTPALFIFLQPTPQQLLSLSMSPFWKAIAWDGSHYEMVLDQVLGFEENFSEQMNQKSFIEICKSWFRLNQSLPGFIEWINPPGNKKYNRALLLDRSKGILSIGAEQSGADFVLPLAGKSEKAHIAFNGEKWILKKIQLEGVGQAQEIYPGFRFQVEGYEFVVRMNSKVEEFIQLAQKSKVIDVHVDPITLDDSLKDLCLSYLLSSQSGELQIREDIKNGYIYFQNGNIVAAYTGAVSGKKALARMLGWIRFQYKFNHEVNPPKEVPKSYLNTQEFDGLTKEWARDWQKWNRFLPPPHTKLMIDTQQSFQKKDWNLDEFLVFQGVREFQVSKDILNYVDVSDLKIIQTLVSLRKQGLIKVA